MRSEAREMASVRKERGSIRKEREEREERKGGRTETVPVVDRTDLDSLLVQLVALAAFFADCVAPPSFANLLRSS
jgi:hypothetical protein